MTHHFFTVNLFLKIYAVNNHQFLGLANRKKSI